MRRRFPWLAALLITALCALAVFPLFAAEGVFGFGSYLPLALRAENPTATPIPTATPLPAGTIANGDFELGQAGWDQSTTADTLPIDNAVIPGLIPHSGVWYAWLGGLDDDVSAISQQVAIPSGNPSLTYWHWIASNDTKCQSSNDIGGVVLVVGGQNKAVDAYSICSLSNTGGWRQRVVNLAAYAGQTVELVILSSTDASVASNLFIDDVAFGGPVAPPPPTATPAPRNCSSAYPGVCIPPPPPDLDCSDISFRNFTVLSPDPHNFDTDNDGVGCESGLMNSTRGTGATRPVSADLEAQRTVLEAMLRR